MGFLDDAIREHVQLKRRNGADPTEIEKIEREALEPAADDHQPAITQSQVNTGAEDAKFAREVSEPLDAMDAHDALLDQVSAHTALTPQRPAGDQTPQRPADNQASTAGAVDSLVEQAGGDPIEESLADRAPTNVGSEQRYAVDNAEGLPDDGNSTTRSTLDPKPELYLSDDNSASVPAEEKPTSPDDDVLDLTPDFLQETPEHDRLWFEQKPPKDFDFDG